MGAYLGQTMGNICRVSSRAANGHIGIDGISGRGKSCRGQRIELEAAKDGKTVVVLDINESHADEMIFPPIREEYFNWTNRIDARKDGLNFSFLRPMKKRDGSVEDFVSLVNSATYALSAVNSMGIRQLGALREAVIFGVKNLKSFPNEMTAIENGLSRQEEDNPVARAVYEKLWTLLNSNIFRPSEKNIQEGKINIISLTGMDKLTQAALAEVVLSNLWRASRYQVTQGNLMVSIDEFQNLSLREGSTLRDMLREGRKFGINLLLMTQTLAAFPKDTLAALYQMATWLHFQPAASEARSISKMIAPLEVDKWHSTLCSLQVGEAVTVGNLCIGKREIYYPIITK